MDICSSNSGDGCRLGQGSQGECGQFAERCFLERWSYLNPACCAPSTHLPSQYFRDFAAFQQHLVSAGPGSLVWCQSCREPTGLFVLCGPLDLKGSLAGAAPQSPPSSWACPWTGYSQSPRHLTSDLPDTLKALSSRCPLDLGVGQCEGSNAHHPRVFVLVGGLSFFLGM